MPVDTNAARQEWMYNSVILQLHYWRAAAEGTGLNPRTVNDTTARYMRRAANYRTALLNADLSGFDQRELELQCYETFTWILRESIMDARYGEQD